MAGFSNDVMFASNVRFDGVDFPGQVVADGQLLIGNAVFPNIRVGTLTSPGGTLTIGYLAPNITIDLAGGSIGVDSIGVQNAVGPGTNPVLPTGAGLVTINGAAVAPQLIPIRSNSIAANTLQIEVQRASSSAATNATQQGLSSYNSAHFSVDANGWVSLAGGGIAFDEINVQAVTAPGVTPVLPSAGGALTLSGAIVAASAVPVQSRSIALNQLQIEVQTSSAQAVDTASANGLCHFNSGQFTVSATGFVSLVSGTAPWLESAGGLLSVNTGYFANAAAVYTLPAAPTIGQIVEIIDNIGGGVVVTANAGQTIRIGNVASSVGGTATSTQLIDGLRLVWRVVNSSWECCPGASGNWILA